MDKPTLIGMDGSSLRELRSKLRLNQRDFWNNIGVTQSGGCRYENGRTIPRPVIYLVNIAYGTEAQADSVVAWLRRSMT